ncbi:MAG: helix-turn-helix transcriptional regulator [Myxococcales bacterium]|nr:helix-turn-helix transcriptional regulator [Myxococcales bacterium]
MSTSLGERIKILRKRKGWRVQDLADQVEVSKGMISHIERGEKQPGRETILKIADAFSISPGLLLDLSVSEDRLVEISLVLEKARHLSDENLDLVLRLLNSLEDA